MNTFTFRKANAGRIGALAALLLASTQVFSQVDAGAKPLACQMMDEDAKTMAMQKNTNLRNVSWGEVIFWCGDGATFNTVGLNDPKDSAPDVLFSKIQNDKAALAKKYGVEKVSTNPDGNRRYWTLDEIHIEASTTVRDFGGIKARYIGTLKPKPDGSPQDLSPALIPRIKYMKQQFNRVSTIVFNKGKPVYLLTDPSGTQWVIKTYSTNVDPTLSYETLPTLGQRLKDLPEGWKFRSQVLDQDLVIKAAGAQRIMWDELGNSWDALEPAFVSFMPK